MFTTTEEPTVKHPEPPCTPGGGHHYVKASRTVVTSDGFSQRRAYWQVCTFCGHTKGKDAPR